MDTHGDEDKRGEIKYIKEQNDLRNRKGDRNKDC